MPQLTVFLVRSGETLGEGSSGNDLRMHQKVDPPLTLRGYQQAKDTYTALIKAICDETPIPARRGDSDGDGVIDPLRNMACFAAPLKACQSTALMLSACGLAQQDKLTWRYTTVEAASSPSAVPVITVNPLCAAQAEIIANGGVQTVIDAGLLHTAAAPWNDARVKCPFMHVCVKEMKVTAGDYVKAYKEDRRANPPNRVLEVQYLWYQDAHDPWSLAELTPKVNVCIDMLPVNKYRPPPRKGNLDCKLPGSLEHDAVDGSTGAAVSTKQSPQDEAAAAVADAVWKARQVGCDTVLFAVPATAMESLLERASGNGSGNGNISQQSYNACSTPCSVVTLTATVDDGQGAAGIAWTLVGAYTSPQVIANAVAAVPMFSGPVECIVPPPEGKDPASVPANQWSAFPPPEPENIPDDYPDLPPFGAALSATYPTTTTTGPIGGGGGGGGSGSAPAPSRAPMPGRGGAGGGAGGGSGGRPGGPTPGPRSPQSGRGGSGSRSPGPAPGRGRPAPNGRGGGSAGSPNGRGGRGGAAAAAAPIPVKAGNVDCTTGIPPPPYAKSAAMPPTGGRGQGTVRPYTHNVNAVDITPHSPRQNVGAVPYNSNIGTTTRGVPPSSPQRTSGNPKRAIASTRGGSGSQSPRREMGGNGNSTTPNTRPVHSPNRASSVAASRGNGEGQPSHRMSPTRARPRPTNDSPYHAKAVVASPTRLPNSARMSPVSSPLS